MVNLLNLDHIPYKMSSNRILVTAALPYINNVPHMGHIVGSHLPADIFYRYMRSKGVEALFIGGSDEHGTPSAIAAKELGLQPQQLVDRLHEIHQRVYRRLNIAYDNYSRTSNPIHHDIVRAFFERIQQNEFTHMGKIEMYFCKNDNMFLPDRYLVGTCPKCDYEAANADQCESCTTVLSPQELIDPHCKSCGSEPVMRESEHVYIDLGKLADRLNTWVESRRDTWRSNVYSEAKKWLNEGLRSRSITRDMEWGIHLPVKGLEDKVFSVWFDAPIGYMTFTREMGQDVFEEYWKNPDSKIFHFLGKDNIPFHTIFWPSMLLAHGGLNLPFNVVGQNYLNFEGQKFSKSKGIGVFCYNLLDSDVNIDVLRSYLTTVIPESRDADFKWDGLKTITNSELIGKLGNFFNRTLTLVWKNFEGRLNYQGIFSSTDLDSHMIEVIRTAPHSIGDAFARAEFREAYRRIMQYATEGNVYLDRTAPWKSVASGNLEEARRALYLAVNLCRSLAIVAHPILPESMQRMWSEQLNLDGSVSQVGLWNESTNIGLPADHSTKPPSPLYSRFDDASLASLRKHLSKSHSLEELVRT